MIVMGAALALLVAVLAGEPASPATVVQRLALSQGRFTPCWETEESEGETDITVPDAGTVDQGRDDGADPGAESPRRPQPPEPEEAPRDDADFDTLSSGQRPILSCVSCVDV